MPEDEGVSGLVARGYDVQFHSHARAILEADFPDALRELTGVLLGQMIPIEEIIGSGGGETKGTQRLRHGLDDLGWRKTNFTIEKRINGVERESISHEVDHVRVFESEEGMRAVALEIEWNNKDPFFDRDLENYKRLHAEGAISVGVVVTRGASLQAEMLALVRRWADERQIRNFEDLERHSVAPTPRQRREVMKRVTRERVPIPFAEAWASHFVSDKFGAATTHWEKLHRRVERGVGNPCPLLLIGLPASVVSFGEDEAVVQALLEEGAEEVSTD